MNASSDWQHKFHNIKNRNLHMLKNEILTDCKFLVGRENDRKEIAAHRLILASASPVFEKMFYGQLVEKDNPIHIPDVRPETFVIMLEYIYADQINIRNLGYACGLYYLSAKYMIPDIARNCTQFMCNNVNERNVLQLYEFAELFDLKTLKDKCMQFIIHHARDVLNQPNFLEISITTLMTILDQNKLNINSELDLFYALERFAQKRVLFENETEHNKEELKATNNSNDEIITFFYDFYDEFEKEIINKKSIFETKPNAISNKLNIKSKPTASKFSMEMPQLTVKNIFQPPKELNFNFATQNSVESSCQKNIQNMNIQETTMNVPFVFKFGGSNGKDKSENIQPVTATTTKQLISEESFRLAVKKIRFLTMTPQEFAEGPAVSKLLKPNESLAFFIIISKPFNPKTSVPEGFCNSFIKREKN